MADPECLHDIGSPDGYLRLRHLAHWWHPEEAGHGRLCGCKQVSTRLVTTEAIYGRKAHRVLEPCWNLGRVLQRNVAQLYSCM